MRKLCNCVNSLHKFSQFQSLCLSQALNTPSKIKLPSYQSLNTRNNISEKNNNFSLLLTTKIHNHTTIMLMEVTTETRKTHLPSNGNWLSKYLVAALVSSKVDNRANAHVACNVKE